MNDNIPPNILMRAMRFGGKDLELNRAGQMSNDQRRRLQREQLAGAVGWWLLAFIGLLVFIFPNHWHLDFPNLLLNFAAIVVGISMAFWRQYQTRMALKDNTADVITGPIKKTCRTEGRSKVYRVKVEGRTFKIEKTAYDFLTDGESYSFYYVPETGTLLSVEESLTEEAKGRLSESKAKNDDANILIPDSESHHFASR